MTREWFTVDRAGLGRILRRRGIEFVLWELVSNAWDADDSKAVAITLTRIDGTRDVLLTVEDDSPDGFRDLSHAWTLFADSDRRGDAEKRGRFNLGEKLVLAVARSATILTTTAGVRFDGDGRHVLRQRRECGSRIEVVLPMTNDDVARVTEKVRLLLPPIDTSFNGLPIVRRIPKAHFGVSLPTVLPNADGYLEHATRKTRVEVHEKRDGETWLYELGVPVVELEGETFSYDVLQKMPVTMDRDNVPPSYLRALRTFAFNELHRQTTSEDCNAPWVRDALTDDRVTPEAVRTAVQRRFGDKVVAYDPSDREANLLAASSGYTVVHGSQLSRKEWEHVREAKAIPAAGAVTPSPKPYSSSGLPQHEVKDAEWTPGMKRAAEFAQQMGRIMLQREIGVKWVNETIGWNYTATYGPDGILTLNQRLIPKTDYEEQITRRFVALLIHEFGHEYESNHLSSNYHEVLCDLGARLWEHYRKRESA